MVAMMYSTGQIFVLAKIIEYSVTARQRTNDLGLLDIITI